MKAFLEGALIIVCWLITLYFAYAALWPFFPAPSIIEGGRYVYLLLAVFFFVVPISQKVEIFKFLSFESRLSALDEKQQQHDAEIKQIQQIQATVTNTLSSVSTNSNSINFYGREKAVEAVAENLAQKKPSDLLSSETQTGLSLHIDPPPATDQDALFKWISQNVEAVKRQLTPKQEVLFLFSELNLSLRVSVGRNLEVYQSRKEAKYMSIKRLWLLFISQYPEKRRLDPSFEYFFNVASAAANGQNVPDPDLVSAITVGRALLQDVRDTPTVQSGSIEPDLD